MNVADLICRKRDGHQLEDEQIEYLVAGYSNGEIPDYQVSAFAMAVYFQGMEAVETVALTKAFINSGETMTWPAGKPKVDKHSTGGIGDKVSIPLAPLLACCGVDVPMISGRGLGATGGTLDKLESIPGYRCDLSADEFRSIVNWYGFSITCATSKLAPADKKLYALRDVTGTVPSIPLITASILSKKIAEGISSLVLDVKCGSGAFMKTQEQATKLAKTLVGVANQLGVRTTALITDMNQPLGRMIGNAVEIDESIDILKGDGPADVTELMFQLGSQLLVSSGVSNDDGVARKMLREKIEFGDAYKRFVEMVEGHGGNLNAKRERADEHVVKAVDGGYVSRINAERLGLAVIEMGGGRKKLGDKIDHSVGIEFLVRIGDKIEKNQPIANIFCPRKTAEYAASLVNLSIGTSGKPVDALPLVLDTIQ